MYDIDSKQLLDKYPLYAGSSPNISYDRNGYPDFTTDLGDNFVKSLEKSLFC